MGHCRGWGRKIHGFRLLMRVPPQAQSSRGYIVEDWRMPSALTGGTGRHEASPDTWALSGRPARHADARPERAAKTRSGRYSTGLLVSTFSVFGGSDFGGYRLGVSSLISGIRGDSGRAAEHEPRSPVVKLLLVQEFSPFVLRNFRTELHMLEQLEMMEGVRIPHEK